MKHLLIIFWAALFMGILVTSAKAKQSRKVDEIEALLQKVSANVESAAKVTQMAELMNAEMLTTKIAEKADLQNEVATAKVAIAAGKKQINNYIRTMLIFDIDTALTNIEEDTLHLNNMLKLNRVR